MAGLPIDSISEIPRLQIFGLLGTESKKLTPAEADMRVISYGARISIYGVRPSCSAMERVTAVCSEPVWRVVTVSMRAIQVSSVAEVL